MNVTFLSTGGGGFPAVVYNEKKVARGEVERIEQKGFFGPSSAPGSSISSKVGFLNAYSSQNGNVKNPQFHVAMSVKGRSMTAREIKEIAHQWLTEMGYGHPDQPILIYAHYDTANTHIHIVSSRVDPMGHKINDHHEARRGRAVLDRILGLDRHEEVKAVVDNALSYRFASMSLFRAIVEASGVEVRQDNRRGEMKFFKNESEQYSLPISDIRAKMKDDEVDEREKKRVRALLYKTINLCGNREELAEEMHRKFGISIVFIGATDKPGGFVAVDHRNKVAIPGRELMPIKKMAEFKSREERRNDGIDFIREILRDEPRATAREINLKLRRSLGLTIRGGKLWYKKEGIELPDDIRQKIKFNHRVAWWNRFQPSTESERELICKVSRLEAEHIELCPPGGCHDSSASLYKLFEDSTRDDIRINLKNAGFMVVSHKDEMYALGVDTGSITNLNSIGVDLSLLQRGGEAIGAGRESSVSRSRGETPSQSGGMPSGGRSVIPEAGRSRSRDWEISSGEDDEEEEERLRRRSRGGH